AAAHEKDYHEQIWQGRVLVAAGKEKEAEKPLRRAVELADNVPDTWLALVLYLVRMGRLAEADDTTQQAEAKLGKGSPVALALCREALGQNDQAQRLYQAALKENPQDLGILRSAAQFAIRVGRPQEAKPSLQALIDLKAKSPRDAAWARRTLGLLIAAEG